MSLADDLAATAVSAAAQAITPLVAAGAPDPVAVARAAVRAAQPFLEDALRVRDAVDAREGATQRRTRRAPAALWQRADGDEGLYLELMRQHGWLELATIPPASPGGRGALG